MGLVCQFNHILQATFYSSFVISFTSFLETSQSIPSLALCFGLSCTYAPTGVLQTRASPASDKRQQAGDFPMPAQVESKVAGSVGTTSAEEWY